ncbi:hypothetical protein [Polyangium aurulentum]|uniref:hypothetical protein n=1 Tax=Polyangium aurulentum TaxID=2567896 RepID=UPI00146BB92D|nr:hypothetical protein [Polyangium aurulentum]UQA60270.1 hypothetical protein E8A73_007275 [Polyangium aurulentum]
MRNASSPRRAWTSCLGAAVLLAGLAACGGPTFDGSVYRGEGYAFKVPKSPASWQRLDVDKGALAFRDEANDATIAVSGRCKVDGEDVPLRSLTQHLFLQFTEREILTEEVVPFDGREAMHTVVVAKLDGVPNQFDVWILKKDGCVYDLYYIAPPARFEAGVGAFRDFVKGFTTVPRNADD